MIIIKNFIYHVPTKIFFGKDQEKNVGKIIKEYKFKKVLIHYGMGSVIKSGLLETVTNSLEQVKISYILLGGVKPNPELSKVIEGVKLCKENQVDFILAVGGGSVIDSAKLIANGAKVDFNPWEFSLKVKIPNDALKVGTILTLAASGSEMSQSCVITNEKTHQKRGFNSYTNRPLFSILNPELTYTVSKFQTGCGIVDILMHTLERYYTDEKDVLLTDYLSEGLFKAVIEAGRKVLKDLNDYSARATLMWASSISHNDLMGVGRDVMMSVHQLEHEVSGLYPNIAHGAGLSALFCSWARYVYKVDVNKFARFGVNVFGIKNSEDIDELAIHGIDILENYFREIEMPTNLKSLGVKEADLYKIAKMFTFNGERPVFNDIYPITENDAFEILKQAYDA